MPLELTFRTDDLARHDTLTIPDEHAGEVVVGRKKACDIFLPVPSLSGKHLKFKRRDGSWWVEDLGSTNGTFADGERLEAGAPIQVRAGMSLMTTGVQIVVRMPSDASEQSFTIETSGSMSKAMIKALLEQQQQGADPYFDLIAPGERDRVFLGMSFHGKRVGAHPTAEVRTKLEAAPAWMFQVFEDVSGRVLLEASQGVLVERNGELLEGRELLRHEDMLKVGELTCQFFDPLEGDIPLLESGDEPGEPEEAQAAAPLELEDDVEPSEQSSAPVTPTPSPHAAAAEDDDEPSTPPGAAPQEPAKGSRLGVRELVVLAFALGCVLAALAIAYVFLL
ncbi:MAG: FHA domain-containing protein [Myxococcota bacterium]